MATKFTYDDILLVPGYFKNSEEEIDTSVELFGRKYPVPIMSAPMETVTELEMMEALYKLGAVGVHHRYSEELLEPACSTELGGIAISPSLGVDFVTHLALTYPNTFFVGDVAHAHTKRNIDFYRDLILNGVTKLVTGNLVTIDAVYEYLKIGVKHFRVGIGNGSVCSTRSVTGFGYPQGSAINELRRAYAFSEAFLIADGGINTTGDIVKAFALGADFVMSGRLFAGTDQVPKRSSTEENDTIPYRGMASADALSQRKSEFFVEGETIKVKPKGAVSLVVKEIKDALVKGCYYGGVNSVRKLYANVHYIRVSPGTYYENQVRK